MNRIHKLIMLLAVFIFGLSVYIVFSVFTFNRESALPLINTSNPLTKEETPGTENKPNKELEELLTESVSSKIPLLSEEELKKIAKIRSPFGASPIVDKDFKEVEKVYQAKLKAQKEKVERENSIKALTELINRNPTDKEIEKYLFDGTIPELQTIEEGNIGEYKNNEIPTINTDDKEKTISS